jgi:glycosyltransferase involved in cell wall biosynthesis
MPATRFSIVITSYNQLGFIKDAVDSALSLRNTDREIIVVDDASTDGSQDILRRYGDAIRLVCLEANQGAGAARNCGAGLAIGEYLVFLDGDDAFLPWALEVYEKVVQARKPKLILCRMVWFKGKLPSVRPVDDPNEVEIVEYEDYMRKDRSFGVSASALVIERQSFQSVQGYARDIFPMRDSDLLFRLSDSGRTVQILSPRTTFYRVHAGQTINQVPLFIGVLSKLIRKEGLGQYPGGQRRRRERYALIGGPIFFWARRAFKAGLYWEAVKLLARAWPMVFVAVIRKLGVIIKGRRPCETIEM